MSRLISVIRLLSDARKGCRLALFPVVIICATVLLLAPSSLVAYEFYSFTNLGVPTDADSVIGVRMNNLGHVAGYSQYYGAGEPSLRGWVWTPDTGFTILPPPPDMYLGRSRAMDISDTGIVAGDGGFDAGIAWRYEDSVYETFGEVGDMFIAYLGGVNDSGDVAGTSKDASIVTEDEAFLDINGVGTIHLTPGDAGGRASDVNNNLQVCGYTQGPMSGFEAFRWEEATGFLFLGTLDLAYSYAASLNESGQVVGSASSATGNTSKAWIYTEGAGMMQIPAPVTESSGGTGINNYRHVVGTTHRTGPDLAWLWTGGSTVTDLNTLFDSAGEQFVALAAHDINDRGQILAFGFDNGAGEFRTALLTPPILGVGACCLDGGNCIADATEDECADQGGEYLGDASPCDSCIPNGACCLTDGSCLDFLSEDACADLAGVWQGQGTGCATSNCPAAGLPNDDCSSAISIVLGDTPFSTLGATTDGPALPSSCSEPAGTYFGMDIWYFYEPEGDGILTVSTCNQADYDTRLAAYTGGCGTLEIAGCNDDVPPPTCYYGTSIMEVPVTRGEPLLIRVGSFSVYTGTGILTLTMDLSCDDDGDGYQSEACGGDDCDDSNPEVNPGHTEVPENGIDDDCDGQVDEGCFIGMLR